MAVSFRAQPNQDFFKVIYNKWQALRVKLSQHMGNEASIPSHYCPPERDKVQPLPILSLLARVCPTNVVWAVIMCRTLF